MAVISSRKGLESLTVAVSVRRAGVERESIFLWAIHSGWAAADATQGEWTGRKTQRPLIIGRSVKKRRRPGGNKKAARRLLFRADNADAKSGVARAHGAGETGAELLDAASFHNAGLGAGVEGVRLGGDVTLEQGVGLALVFDGFACVHGRAGDDLRAGLLIQEHHFAVFGVDAFFHVDSCRECLGRQPQSPGLGNESSRKSCSNVSVDN